MSELLNSETNSYEYIEEVCKKHDISISELCRRADVTRQLLKAWRNGDPKSITALKAVNVQLELILKESNTEHEFSPDPVKVEESKSDIKTCTHKNEPCKFNCSDSQCKLID